MMKLICAAICCLIAIMVSADSIPSDARVVLPSTFQGKSFVSFVTDAQLEATPSWLHARNQDPPLSPMQGVVISQSTLEELIPVEKERRKWQLADIMLVPLAEGPVKEPKGYYVVTWRGPSVPVRDDEASKKIAPRSVYRDAHDEFRLIVLLDGKCIRPKVITPNKSQEGIGENAEPSE